MDETCGRQLQRGVGMVCSISWGLDRDMEKMLNFQDRIAEKNKILLGLVAQSI